MSSAVAKIAKPVLRGYHLQEIKRNVILATAVSCGVSAAWYFFVNKARRDNYVNFYKNYDAEADFQRMKAAGVFNCCKEADEEE